MVPERKPGTKTKRAVFVIDDHPIVREGLTQLINREPDLVVCGHAEYAYEAVKSVELVKPDVAIADISLKGTDGIELIKNLKTRAPALAVLVLSIHDESLYAARALRAGARGYIMKQEATENVLIALRRVLNGEIYLSERMSNKMLQQFVGLSSTATGFSIDRLSDRELEVFRLIGEGHGTRRIAEELRLSIKTVESYREHIKDKMTLSDANELVQHAVHWVQQEKVR
ncbi:MAG: response regulator transcription factor [Candidatus Binatia bacterium]